MTSYDTSRPLTGRTAFGAGPFAILAAVFGRIAAWNDARITRNALSKLSDHELDDLGLTRGDIARFDGHRRV